MVPTGSDTLLLHLWRAALRGHGPEISDGQLDGQLLEQFIGRRDEAAQAASLRLSSATTRWLWVSYRKIRSTNNRWIKLPLCGN